MTTMIEEYLYDEPSGFEESNVVDRNSEALQELSVDCPEQSIDELLDELEYYVGETEERHEYWLLEITMRTLDTVYRKMEECGSDCEDYWVADCRLDEILPLWIAFWVTVWQQQEGLTETESCTKKRILH